MLQKGKLIYIKLLIYSILYPNLCLITFIIIFLMIRSCCYNIINIDYIPTYNESKIRYKNIIKQLPEVKVIVDYFNYKLDFTRKCNVLFYINNNTKYDTFIQMMKIKAIKQEFSDNNYTLEIPLTNPETPINFIIIEEKPSHIKPNTFYVIDENIADTIVIAAPIINNDFGFEAPIEIKVEKTLDLIVQNDLGYSIIQPSFEGETLYTKDEIYNLHIAASQIIKDKLQSYDNLNLFSEESREIIRQGVKDYMIKFNLFSNLDHNSLRNSNFIVNLLIYEIVMNYILMDDLEKFISLNICGALIVESICYVEHNSVLDFYNDTEGCNMSIRNILRRFVNEDFESILVLDKKNVKSINIFKDNNY